MIETNGNSSATTNGQLEAGFDSSKGQKQDAFLLTQALTLSLEGLKAHLLNSLSLHQGPLKSSLDTVLHDPYRFPDTLNSSKLVKGAVELLNRQAQLLSGPETSNPDAEVNVQTVEGGNKKHGEYIMGHDSAEVSRLRGQHKWIKASLGNLIHAPINPRQKNLRILDSGTADGKYTLTKVYTPVPPFLTLLSCLETASKANRDDLPGYWLADILPNLPATTTLIGTDIAPHLYDYTLSPNILFATQSITSPWPASFQNSFDLVHQRLVLAACSPTAAASAIKALFELAKPGSGWIQLLECDHSGGFNDEQKAQWPRTREFGELVMKALECSGQYGQQGKNLRRWIEEAGAVDVVEVRMDVPVGKRADTDELRKITTNNLLSVVGNLKGARKGKSGVIFITSLNKLGWQRT